MANELEYDWLKMNHSTCGEGLAPNLVLEIKVAQLLLRYSHNALLLILLLQTPVIPTTPDLGKRAS